MQSTADIAVTIDKEWESYWRARNENPLDDAETLKFRVDGAISKVEQKPKSLDEVECQYMGLMKFFFEGIKQMKNIFHTAVTSGELLGKRVENSYMKDMLQAIINNGNAVTAISVNDLWVEVDDEVSNMNFQLTRDRLKQI